jgi:thiosulfate/3-mercaptopyruvate sulfurtransferase
VRGVIPPVVDMDWVRGNPGAVLADVRWDLARGPLRDEYASGHLPGAVFVDLDTDLSAPATPQDGRHPLPEPEAFAAAMGAIGIGDDDIVVAYDDAGGINAARMVWMLRALGRDAALLDGPDGLTETGTNERPPATFTARPWPPELVATPDDAADPAVVTIDGRQRERFDGAPNPADPRPGHIPGAHSASARDNVAPGGRLRAPEELRERFEALGIGPDSDVVSYCGSGVTACHNLLMLEHAGLGRGRLYPGSWSQWAADPDRPVETP